MLKHNEITGKAAEHINGIVTVEKEDGTVEIYPQKVYLNGEYDLRKHVWDLVNGFYSGLPDCCIYNFINMCVMCYESPLRDTFIGPAVLSQIINNRNNADWNYVPCQKCSDENNKVAIKNNGFIEVKKEW